MRYADESSALRRRSRGGRRVAGGLAVVMLGFGIFTLEPGSAAPVALTSNSGNSMSTIMVPPPTAVATTMTLNAFPVLTCRVTVQWTAPGSPGVDGFEVRRVVGGVPAGPWPAPSSPFIDPAVPLISAATVATWQVRSKWADTNWRSEWVTAVNTDLLPCLLAGPEGILPDQPASDDGAGVDDLRPTTDAGVILSAPETGRTETAAEPAAEGGEDDVPVSDVPIAPVVDLAAEPAAED